MDSKESMIREKRTMQALRNDLMGPGGKLGTICRYLGHKIQFQSRTDGLFLDDPYDLPIDDPHSNEALLQELPEFDEDEITYEVGWMFDGLSRGMHLEIKYIDHEKSLTATYKGYVVFSEVAGELESYAPFPEWEDLIERLYKVAKDKRKELKRSEKKDREKLVNQKQNSFLERMRMKWGI